MNLHQTNRKLRIILALLLCSACGAVSACALKYTTETAIVAGWVLLGSAVSGFWLRRTIVRYELELQSRHTKPMKMTAIEMEGTSFSAPKLKLIRVRVSPPPGSHLHAWAGFFYSKKTIERIFDPMLADMREEYFEALAKGRKWKARWVRLSYYWAFAKVLPLQALVKLGKQILEIWKLVL